jgi:hypothetical protein
MFHVPSPTLKNLLNNIKAMNDVSPSFLAQMLLLGLLGFYDYDQPMKLHKTICVSMIISGTRLWSIYHWSIYH